MQYQTSALHNFVTTLMTMKAINSLLTFLTYTTPIHHNNILFFYKLSKVTIFPEAIVHTKNATLDEALLFKYSSKENENLLE
jgi:hypothetical protein